MNLATLRKLKANPHYKLTAKQEALLKQLEEKENKVRNPMIEIGRVPINQTPQPELATHPTSMVRNKGI